MAGSFHDCPLLQAIPKAGLIVGYCKLKCVGPGEGKSELVILIYLKTVIGKSCLGSEVELWPVNSEKQTLVSGHQSSLAMDGLPWEVGSPCHGGCSETA